MWKFPHHFFFLMASLFNPNPVTWSLFGTWHDFVSLIVQRWSYLRFPSPSSFGHMCILYNPDPKLFLQKNIVHIKKIKVKFSQIFLMIISSQKRQNKIAKTKKAPGNRIRVNLTLISCFILHKTKNNKK